MSADVLTLDPRSPDGAALDRAARVLRGGGLVAFPTETVYGLGANADDPVALERLVRVKRRPEGKSFTLLLADARQVPLHVASVPWRASRLMGRYWPGPLTIVVPGKREPTVGLRVPAGRIPQELLRRCGVPIAAPSANRSGEEPPSTAAQVAAALGGEIDLILDGGPTQLAEASTVVRLTGKRLEVLREGILTAAMVERTASIGVLFVCTGNTCRSPMAEGLWRRRLSERLGVAPADLGSYGYRCASAGLAGVGMSASSGAVRAMAGRGIDLGAHRSRSATAEEIRGHDFVFGMTRLHVERCQEAAPDVAERISLLAPDGREVHDPAWGTDEEYRRCADDIDAHVRARLETILLWTAG